jgi:hypothetical protein
MKTATSALFVVLISLLGVAQNANWKPYVSKELGFELAYPAGYHQAELPCEIARSAAASGVQSLLYLKKGTGRDEGTIHVTWNRCPLNLKLLQSGAPTGWDEPEQVKVGKLLFYYYGAGGGGVSYPDQYFFDLNGHTLTFVFDGPYPPDSKSPTDETKRIEQKMLESFRLWDKKESRKSSRGQPDDGEAKD